MSTSDHPIAIAITGASGAACGLRLLEVLLLQGCRVHLVISGAARQVFRQELAVDLPERPQADDVSRLVDQVLYGTLSDSWAFQDIRSEHHPGGKLTSWGLNDYSAGIASGSFVTRGMVICPCSMGTLSAIATGASGNLIHRAADVHLKERRPLILVPRETPLSSIQLRNMSTVSEAGATVLPAMPGYYHKPLSIGDLVDFVVARICDHLRVSHKLGRRWGSD